MIFVLVLLWVLPEGPTPPEKILTQVLIVVATIDLTLPAYYTVQVAGLPWISARRIFTFVFIILFAITYSASKQARERIASIIRYNRIIFVCAFGFLAMVFISIVTSISPAQSLTGAVNVVLEWYVPFIAVLYVLRKDEDVERLFLLILSCAIFTTVMGLIEYKVQHRIYLDLMPKSFIVHLAENNPRFAAMVQTTSMRNGQYRASSLFGNALTFAEFEAMVAPLGVVFMIHGRTLFKRLFGAAVVAFCCAGIFVSGSRGGILSFLVASATFISLFVIRNRLMQPRGLAWPLFGMVGVAGAVVVGLAITLVGRIHGVVTGGGAGTMSDDGRREQWRLGWPHILANPITGHGYDMSGTVIGWAPAPGAPPSVDSYALTLLVEMGVPSLLCFFGMTLFCAWIGARRYFRDPTWAGALSAGLASSLIGFSFYRLFLSQTENHTLLFLMIACVALLNYFFERAKEQRPASLPTSSSRLAPKARR